MLQGAAGEGAAGNTATGEGGTGQPLRGQQTAAAADLCGEGAVQGHTGAGHCFQGSAFA